MGRGGKARKLTKRVRKEKRKSKKKILKDRVKGGESEEIRGIAPGPHGAKI